MRKMLTGGLVVVLAACWQVGLREPTEEDMKQALSDIVARQELQGLELLGSRWAVNKGYKLASLKKIGCGPAKESAGMLCDYQTQFNVVSRSDETLAGSGQTSARFVEKAGKWYVFASGK